MVVLSVRGVDSIFGSFVDRNEAERWLVELGFVQRSEEGGWEPPPGTRYPQDVRVRVRNVLPCSSLLSGTPTESAAASR